MELLFSASVNELSDGNQLPISPVHPSPSQRGVLQRLKYPIGKDWSLVSTLLQIYDHSITSISGYYMMCALYFRDIIKRSILLKTNISYFNPRPQPGWKRTRYNYNTDCNIFILWFPRWKINHQGFEKYIIYKNCSHQK